MALGQVEREEMEVTARRVRAGLIPADKIKVPLALATGKYEELTNEELNDHYYDIRHERERRGFECACHSS